MSNEHEKARLGAGTLKDFCQSWGDDIHARILLEVLFKGLMNEETLFIFGEPQQTRDQTNNDSTGRSSNRLQNNGSQIIQPTTKLGEEDPANYP